MASHEIEWIVCGALLEVGDRTFSEGMLDREQGLIFALIPTTSNVDVGRHCRQSVKRASVAHRGKASNEYGEAGDGQGQINGPHLTKMEDNKCGTHLQRVCG